MTGVVRLGLDFDNTLIGYDRLFFERAHAEGLVPEALSPTKVAVRDHLRSVGREDDWTVLQGEVYGPLIDGAIPFPGSLEAVQRMTARGVRVCIVSHKTRVPYRGEPHDLRGAALGWLEKNGFLDSGRLEGGAAGVHFASTLDEKVELIAELGCTHFVDDLPEVLRRLPASLGAIRFDPMEGAEAGGPWPLLRSWDDLDDFLP